jgi:hypothetical protein
MITLTVISEHRIHTHKAETMGQLKRIALDTYNVKGFKFYIGDNEDKATTFHRLFKGIRADKS